MNNVGLIIKNSYCNGFFGRRYDLCDSVIESEGKDWVVIRINEQECEFAFFKHGDKQECIDSWCEEFE
jgi:hypothetical protein